MTFPSASIIEISYFDIFSYGFISPFVLPIEYDNVVLYDDDLNRAYAKIVKHEAGIVTLQIVRDNICQYPEGTFLFYSRR